MAADDITEEIFLFWESAISATVRMRWDGLLELVEDQSRISKVRFPNPTSTEF